jgi:quercetin dioxygenase-like cupin family protein
VNDRAAVSLAGGDHARRTPQAAATLSAMKPRDIRDLVHFSDEEPHHETLFESKHMWSEVICLAAAQGLGPMTDAASDAVLAVLSGEVATQVDKARSRMKQWDSLLVPAGSELTLKNASPDPAVVLLVAAPPPTPPA